MVTTLGTAKSNSGVADDIASMTWVGTRTIFDLNDVPLVGDVVRVTGTGKFSINPAAQTTATFNLKLPDTAMAVTASVAITIPAALNTSFFFQFLITFRQIGNQTLQFESNGTILLGNGGAGWCFGPTLTANVPIAASALNIIVVPGNPAPTIVFDQCVIEYLRPPPPPP